MSQLRPLTRRLTGCETRQPRRPPLIVPLSGKVSGAGPPLLLIHGYLGNIRSWASILRMLELHYTCVAVDLPGHGETPASPDSRPYGMDSLVESVLVHLDSLAVARTGVLGYSLGGRIALHLTVGAPGRVAGLMLESADPGIDDGVVRGDRRESDERLAQLIESKGMGRFVDHWQSLPIFASQTMLSPAKQREIRAARMAVSPTAAVGLLRNAGPGGLESLWPALPKLTMPLAYVAGSLDQKYVEVGQRYETTVPAAVVTVVPNAGHAVHLEKPEEFLQAVLAWGTRWAGTVSPGVET